MHESGSDQLKIAVAQIAPHFLNLEASLELACEIIIDAGQAGAELVVLPEAFLSGYPEWVRSLPPDNKSQSELQNRLYARFVANAMIIPGPVTDRLCRAARRSGIQVVIGMTEHDPRTRENICFNTLLFINAQGQILGKQRQLTLNGAERLIWTAGDGSTFGVFNFSFGKVGGLISGDSYMPLIRYTLYEWDVRLCIATNNNQPDENWAISMRHIAREGGIYVIGLAGIQQSINLAQTAELEIKPARAGEWFDRGGSLIVNPRGEIIAGPYWEQQLVFYAELNLEEIISARRLIDVTSQNSRPDIFDLRINTMKEN